MQRVAVKSLTPEITLHHDFFTEDGELLLAKGARLTQQNLDMLRKRNVFDVYILDPFGKHTVLDEDIAQPRQTRPRKAAGEGAYHRKVRMPEIVLAPEFEKMRILSIHELLRLPAVKKLDRMIRAGQVMGRPLGAALKPTNRLIFPGERSNEYKNARGGLYYECLEGLKDLFEPLLAGRTFDIAPLKSLVTRLIQAFDEDAAMFLTLAEIKDESETYLYGHTLNVCILAINIAAMARYNREQAIMIGIGALLHDIGMFLVSEEIRNKREKLTEAELHEIYKHPVTAARMVDMIRHIPAPAAVVAYQSHERENGTGYPRRRQGRSIHGFAKVVQIADAFEALTAPRFYRNPCTPFEAMQVMIGMAETGMIRKDLLQALLCCTSLFPVGSIVELSDHCLARVIQANPRALDKPLVSIVQEPDGKILDGNEIYFCDLSSADGMSVIRALSPFHLPEVDILRGF